MPIASFDNPINPAPIVVDAPAEPDIVIGSREQIFYLLAEAAEIEHTLMCSYLYAAFSLKAGSEAGFSQREAKAVDEWQKVMMSVAIEEMGHLLIVANLTAALGGRPHFTRPNFPVRTGYFPASVVLRLTPFSFGSLDHFIFLERPTGMEQPDAEGFETVAQERVQPYQGLMPSAQDYTTVSHLYEALRANLVAFAERSEEAALFIGPENSQLSPAMVKLKGVELVTNLASASRSIDVIIEQGEGAPTDREDSHYQRFQTIKREYSTLLAENSSFAPAYPSAENPVMRRPEEPAGKILIEAEPATALLDFANAVYGMLLRLLVQSYAKSKPTEIAEKKKMLTAALDLMRVLSKAAKALAKFPASPHHPGMRWSCFDGHRILLA
jgi:hypothetical protein